MTNMLLVSLVGTFFVGIFMIIMSLFAKKFPSKYGSGTGYNSVTSRKSPQVWDYAQQIVPNYLLQTGLILILATLLYLAVEVILVGQFHMIVTKTNMIVNIIIAGIIEITFFARMEMRLHKKLKEKFSRD